MEKLQKFAELGLSETMLKALQKKGFEEPTPIQAQIIPLALTSDRDLVGQAQTGTGKTGAFGIPIIERLKEKSRHVQVIILTPTRELAIQVSEELNSLKGKKKLRVIPIYGGQSIHLQLSQLKKGVDIVVGTPGRVQDHIQRGTLNLSEISYAVLDEADEMLNMGFLEDVKAILTVTNPERKTLLFSATMPREILAVAKRHMKKYDLVRVAAEQQTTELTDQIYFEVAQRDKFEALCRIIDIENEFYGIIFCRTKVDVDKISAHLLDRGYDAEALHGDISQSQRVKILNKFKKRKITVLVATDVAARGIDVQDLTHVINYAIPQNPDAYVHRIGRTGRAGKQGTAITFITPEEYRKLMYIKKAAKTDIRRQKLPKIDDVIESKRNRIKSEIDQASQDRIPKEFYQLAEELLQESTPDQVIAALLYNSFENELNPGSYNEIRDVHPKIQGKTRLIISSGRRDKMTKRKLVTIIKREARIEDRDIDNVRVTETRSFITVPFRAAERILKVFRKNSHFVVEVAGKKN